MFEKAARLKLRFNFKGAIGVEELWDLSLQNLDSIYKDLMSKAKLLTEDSLLTEKTPEQDLVQLRLDIAKYIFMVKQEENKARLAKAEQAKQRERIMDIIADKQDEQLRNMPLDELMKLVN